MQKKKIHLNEFTGKHFHFDNSFWDNPIPCGFMNLYQIGELCCEPGFCINEHEQDVYEITYIISGSGYAYVGGEKVEIVKGDIMINSVGHRHSIVVDKTSIFRYAYIGFVFNDKDNTEDVKNLKAFYDSKAFYAGKAQNNVIFPFMRCIDEFYSQKAGYDKMIRSYCKQIVILAARNFLGSGEHVVIDRGMTRDSTSSVIYSVIRYVEENIVGFKSIKELSKQLGYNYTYLSHLFKDKTGTTLQQYICYKKVEYASQLLKEHEMSPAQVSEILGYESLSSFSKSFKRVMGISPKQYILESQKD